jgi:hypothetical protein
MLAQPSNDDDTFYLSARRQRSIYAAISDSRRKRSFPFGGFFALAGRRSPPIKI